MTQQTTPDLLDRFDSAKMTKTHWRWSILAVLASYFDAGAIVAGAVSLVIWKEAYGIDESTIGILSALSANGISAGIGALVGGRLGDTLGRKKIFALDLILFMIGTLILTAQTGPTMIIIGYLITGFAVGVDIPASWSLIAEFSPSNRRGRVMGLAGVAWLLGPVVVSVLAAVLANLGMLGSRLIFLHLAIVAFVVWWLRRGIPESPRWAATHGKPEKVAEAARMLGIEVAAGDEAAMVEAIKAKTDSGSSTLYRQLFTRQNMRNLAFVTLTYAAWGIPAGTYGFFLPYLLQNAGGNSTAVSNLVNVLNFTLGVVAAIGFMWIGDRWNRRWMWAWGAAACSLAFFGFLIVPITNFGAMMVHVFIISFVGNLTVYPILQLWSVELFPTNVRSTLQGFSFGVMRLVLGVWSLFVAAIATTMGFTALAVMLGGLWAVVFILGTVFGPNTAGRTMAQLDSGT